MEYPPQIGGIATYLAGEVRDHGDVQIIRAQDTFWDKWPVWLPLAWTIRDQFRRHGRDSLWVSHVLPIGYIAYVWKLLFDVPYRVYVHGLDLVLPARSPWKGFWVRRILLSADEIVANSNATAKILSRYSIDPGRARISYPKIRKISTEDYSALGNELREKYHLAHKPILLTISRLIRRKGISFVIRALHEVWKRIPGLVYVVVGDGEERHALESLAKNNSRIILVGAVSEDEKYAWLSACDCFILTPIEDPFDFEGYGIVYKEAQQFGKPVIGSTVGGVPEAIGNDGALVEQGNSEEIARTIVKAMGQ